MNKPNMINNDSQRGVALLVSLIFLLLMTMLGISSMRGTVLEERMAGNWRDQNIALQAAEAALRAAETSFETVVNPPIPLVFPCSSACAVIAYNEQDPSVNYLLRNKTAEITNWRNSANTYPGSIVGAAQAPEYLIEQRAFIRDHLGTGFGVAHETGRHVYQITARGVGQTPQAIRILQTAHAKRYN